MSEARHDGAWWRRETVWAHALLASAVVVLATLSIHSVLSANEGEPSVPLDDSYIHFQFARSFAHLHPFVYTQNSEAVPGASSLLWPALLAPCFWLGLDGTRVIWAAWLFGFAALGLTARETVLLSRGLLSRWVAVATGAMVLAFGGLVWAAGSGMEGTPFAWLLLRSFRRLGEWGEREHAGPGDPLTRELLALSVLTPLMRPEGVVVSLLTAGIFLYRLRARQRALCLVPVAGACLPTLLAWLGTSQLSTTTRQVKWLLADPYLGPMEIAERVLQHFSILYGTLLNGEIWSASVLPQGSGPVAWLAMPALLIRSLRTKRHFRGAIALLAMACLWLPTSYDTFLWNRLRYLWPFAPAWFIGVGALVDEVSDLCARYRPGLDRLRIPLALGVVLLLGERLPGTISDLAESSAAIRAQQVSLGRWAKTHLPSRARIGVNDTGAIAYFSDRQTFDVVGLTTAGEARHWVAGRGSRFEHYEHLSASKRPTHFIVYPDWFGLPPLLGEFLTERYVEATILGGTRMVAHAADFSSLGSGELPNTLAPAAQVIDRLDVADLDSEAAHDYRLLDATREQNQLVAHYGSADGARHGRTMERFRMRIASGGSLVARLGSDRPLEVRVRVDEKDAGTLALIAGDWQEVTLSWPEALAAGDRVVTLDSGAGPFSALYYWSYGAP